MKYLSSLISILLIFGIGCASVQPVGELDVRKVTKGETLTVPYDGYVITDKAEATCDEALIELEMLEDELASRPDLLSRIARNISVLAIGFVGGIILVP